MREISDRNIVSAALLAAAAKLYCAATTFGSGDVLVISRFGQLLDSKGFDFLYRETRLFNHPPVTGALFAILYHFAANISAIGAHYVPVALPFLLRLPSVVADLIAVAILLKLHRKYRRPSAWGLLLFALSPVSFMTSGFHGNVDAIMVCGVLLATYYCLEENVLLSAIALGFACSIKIIPLIIAPALLFFWLNHGRAQGLRFGVMFAFTCLAGWSLALVQSPAPFVRNVLLYPSFSGAWGITFLHSYFSSKFLPHIGQDGKSQLERISWLLLVLKLAIIAAVVGIGWLRRQRAGIEVLSTVAFCWFAFVVLAPGFVPYYLIWMAPFVLCYSTRWYVAVTLASTLYLFVYYHVMSGGMPWNYADLGATPRWVPWGLIPWLVTCAASCAALLTKPGVIRHAREPV